jgi:hypothetical protein
LKLKNKMSDNLTEFWESCRFSYFYPGLNTFKINLFEIYSELLNMKKNVSPGRLYAIISQFNPSNLNQQ